MLTTTVLQPTWHDGAMHVMDALLHHAMYVALAVFMFEANRKNNEGIFCNWPDNLFN